MSGVNSAYSPLPQSNSDSDGSSEEELHISQENKLVNCISKTNSKTEKTYNGQKPSIINYKPLDTDGDIGVTLIKFHSGSDEISVLKPKNNLEVFSTSRKICFALSILLCIFTTIIFIWVLPCNVGTCVSNSVNYNNSWNITLPSLGMAGQYIEYSLNNNEMLSFTELYGPISTVPDSSGKIQNIIFLIKNSVESIKHNFSHGGLLSVQGSNGDVLWKISLNNQPSDVDCKLIDVNLDGIKECLVIGDNFLRAIQPQSGKEIWHAQNPERNQNINHLDFPLIIPDVDGDQVQDLLTSCSFIGTNVSFQNNLVIISGRTGVILNYPLKINSCSEVHNLMFENSSVVSYTCYNSTEKESLQTVNLNDVYNSLRSISKERSFSYKWATLHQHQKESKLTSVDGRRLILENQGHCPQSCILLIDIKDERTGYNNKTIYSYRYKNSFGMTPVIVKSKIINGFIIKFWKWHPRKGKQQASQNDSHSKSLLKNKTKEPTTKAYKLMDSLNLEEEMLLESEPKVQRVKRTADKMKSNSTNISSLGLRVITETIVGITFNESHAFINNMTENEVIQICKKPQSCEPDVNRQKNSITIADLDQDGREELIFFSSSYVHVPDKKEENDGWQLQSKIQVMNF